MTPALWFVAAIFLAALVLAVWAVLAWVAAWWTERREDEHWASVEELLDPRSSRTRERGGRAQTPVAGPWGSGSSAGTTSPDTETGAGP